MNTFQIQMAFAEKGIFAMYGPKGNGFWLYAVGREEALHLHSLGVVEFAKYFWQLMDKYTISPIIKNDGKKSGNPNFWMKKDAVKLLFIPTLDD